MQGPAGTRKQLALANVARCDGKREATHRTREEESRGPDKPKVETRAKAQGWTILSRNWSRKGKKKKKNYEPTLMTPNITQNNMPPITTREKHSHHLYPQNTQNPIDPE